jgi:hypothetical protein
MNTAELCRHYANATRTRAISSREVLLWVILCFDTVSATGIGGPLRRGALDLGYSSKVATRRGSMTRRGSTIGGGIVTAVLLRRGQEP